MGKLVFTFLCIIIVVLACSHEGPNWLDQELSKVIGDPAHYILPNRRELYKIPQNSANPLTKEKVHLGNLLFFEPAFSTEAKKSEGLYGFSCSSCHVPEAGFRPARMQGIADGGMGYGEKGERRLKNPVYKEEDIDAQGARPLSVLNTAYVTNSMWNGSFGAGGVNAGTESVWGLYDPATAINHLNIGSLEMQNIEGLKTHRISYSLESVEKFGYKKLFDEAFPDVPEKDRYSRYTGSLAISAFLRTLLTDQAPFQLWLRGDVDALTESQKRGAITFFGKANCKSCHYEPNLGSIKFEALGVEDLWENGGLKTSVNDRRNLGRGGFTGRPEDLYKFRVPQLYNLGDSGPYFHGGSKHTLEEVVRYFNAGIAENPRVPKEQLSFYLKPLNLTEQEILDLTEFLTNGLRDPNLLRFKPSQVLSGLCFPNNDPLSQSDMNCR